MKRYCLIVFCVVAQIFGMEESVKNWAHDPVVYNSFEQFLGKIDSYKAEPLVGGLLSEAPVMCTVNDRKCVVRKFEGSPNDRLNKVLINMHAANKGIAPKIYFYKNYKKICGDDFFTLIIMDYISTPTLSLEQANNPKIIDIIAKKVRAITQFDKNIATHNKENLFDETIRHYQSVKKKNLCNFDVVLDEVKGAMEVIRQEIDKQNRPLVIGHNDFHPRNIFFSNDDILIIDWDTLAPNYEFGDLTAYSMFSCLSKENDVRLLRQYLQCIPSDADKHYFKLVKLLSRAGLVLSFFEFVDHIPESVPVESIKDFKHYATLFAQGADFDSSDFFYECGMSQLRELRREYKEFENV